MFGFLLGKAPVTRNGAARLALVWKGQLCGLGRNRVREYRSFSSLPLRRTPTSLAAFRVHNRDAVHSGALSLGRPCFVNTDAAERKKMPGPDVKPFERLPCTVKPSHYDLVLVPDLKTFQFDGEVGIDVQVSATYAADIFHIVTRRF